MTDISAIDVVHPTDGNIGDDAPEWAKVLFEQNRRNEQHLVTLLNQHNHVVHLVNEIKDEVSPMLDKVAQSPMGKMFFGKDR